MKEATQAPLFVAQIWRYDWRGGEAPEGHLVTKDLGEAKTFLTDTKAYQEKHGHEILWYKITRENPSFPYEATDIYRWEKDKGIVLDLTGSISQEMNCKSLPPFSPDDAQKVISSLGDDITEQIKHVLLEGMNEELEHCDITGGDPILSAKIALAHLRDDPDYYIKLKKAGL